MGWWSIQDPVTQKVNTVGALPVHVVESIHDGEVKHSTVVNRTRENEDNSDGYYNGDGPSDIMGDAFDEVDKEYLSEWGRRAKPEELVAVFNFCLRGMFPDFGKEGIALDGSGTIVSEVIVFEEDR